MTDLETKLAAEIAQLLEEKKVDVFFGFKKAESPLHPQPAFFTNTLQLSEMVYNGLCQNNLATFIPRYPLDTKIGMVVRGCENRSVNHLIVEKQHARENVFMVGIPCAGLVDWHKLVDAFGEEMTAVSETIDEVVLTFRDHEEHAPRQEYLHDSCLRCVHPNPLNADVTIGEPQELKAESSKLGSAECADEAHSALRGLADVGTGDG
ncbi:MAG: Coenzyme F420 hydrogenase/dehydrogenase, beta subunit C-terminal domain, partial [Anaerolineaceae bacterium]